jgi:hypothetical protein
MENTSARGYLSKCLGMTDPKTEDTTCLGHQLFSNNIIYVPITYGTSSLSASLLVVPERKKSQISIWII